MYHKPMFNRYHLECIPSMIIVCFKYAAESITKNMYSGFIFKPRKHYSTCMLSMANGEMVSNLLGVALALSVGIMLASAGSASSVLGANSTGNASGNPSMKSSNMTSSGKMMNKTGAGNMSKAGNTTVGNVTKVGGGVLTNLSKAVGGGLKGLGNLLAGGKK